MALYKTLSGTPYPLGANFDGNGVNFAIFSAHAQKIELCIFDESGSTELERYEVLNGGNNIWHIYLQNAKPGVVYGYRVYGPYEPEHGMRFNHHKLLYDPYGKKFVGKLIWHKAIFGYDPDSPQQDLSFNELDSAPYVPKSVVVEDTYDWSGDVKISCPLEESIIYETHTRGYTKLHPQLPDSKRGTFAGFAKKPIINYIKSLGVTAVEFLPIHAFFGNRHKKGFVKDNFWGYESFSFFAPEQSYLATDDLTELQDLIKKLHKAGIEVILDVVYNHTGEGNQLGPTLCYRGIDNASYYTLNHDNLRFYYDSTGCGASFNVQNPYVLNLVMDSLRYWVKTFHIDGFRFDLATSLCRVNTEFSLTSPFLYACAQDPELKQIKLIAEPWDTGYGGYQVGAFPQQWSEWNDKYRDVIRRFWKGDKFQVAEFASRVAGSSDVFNYNNRNISASLNFITAHDGFCLADLVSYNNKHNAANGEDNRDGTNSNWSWNSGCEGETDNLIVLENRYLRAKAMFATLMLSFGATMFLSGDEFLKTRMGNNNPYCQDNVLSWAMWEGLNPKDKEQIAFVKNLIALRKKLKVFKRKKFFTGKPVGQSNIKDITWYNKCGFEFADHDWADGEKRAISYCLYDGNAFLLAVFNGNCDDVDWKLPNLAVTDWKLLLDSSGRFKDAKNAASGQTIKLPAWSVVLFEMNNK